MNPSESLIWKKLIPISNHLFLFIYLFLLFLVDYPMVKTTSSFDLRGFWYIMLAVVGVWLIFYVFESFYLKKKLGNESSSRLDIVIYILILIRNAVVLLNVIPFIQLLGLYLIGSILVLIPGSSEYVIDSGFAADPWTLLVPAGLILYVVVVVYRLMSSKRSAI